MKTLYNLIALLLLSNIWANDGLFVSNKIINKTFNVNSNAELEINNKYGNVTLSSWDKNVIEIHIEIQVDGKDKNAVQNKLNDITVNFTSSASKVSAVTEIGKSRGGSKVKNMSIHYTVKLPKNNKINIKNTYGNFNLDELNGSTNLDIAYGSLNIDKLNSTNNNFNLSYTPSVQINYVNKANVNIDYGTNVNIDYAYGINLNSDYTNLNFNAVVDLQYNIDYGVVNINKVTNINGDGDYTNIKIGQLDVSGDLTGSYGAINIAAVKNGFKTLNISANYMPISIGIEEKSSYKLTANSSYASIDYPTNIPTQTYLKKGSKTYIAYTTGNNNAKSSITLDSDYGNIKIKTVN